MKSGPKTREMFLNRAKKSIPLGVNSNFRYWGDDCEWGQTLISD